MVKDQCSVSIQQRRRDHKIKAVCDMRHATSDEDEEKRRGRLGIALYDLGNSAIQLSKWRISQWKSNLSHSISILHSTAINDEVLVSFLDETRQEMKNEVQPHPQSNHLLIILHRSSLYLFICACKSYLCLYAMFTVWSDEVPKQEARHGNCNNIHYRKAEAEIVLDLMRMQIF